MGSRVDEIAELGRLLDAGRISSDEYEQLKRDVLLSIQSPDEQRVELDRSPPHDPTSDEETADASRTDGRGEKTPALFVTALVAGILSIFFGGFVGLLAWCTAVISVVALATHWKRRRRWMAWFGLVCGILFSISNAYLNGHLDWLFESGASSAVAEQAATPDPPTDVPPVTAAPESEPTLGVATIDGMVAEWDRIVGEMDATEMELVYNTELNSPGWEDSKMVTYWFRDFPREPGRWGEIPPGISAHYRVSNREVHQLSMSVWAGWPAPTDEPTLYWATGVMALCQISTPTTPQADSCVEEFNVQLGDESRLWDAGFEARWHWAGTTWSYYTKEALGEGAQERIPVTIIVKAENS